MKSLPVRIAILGGGISGLAFAWYLQKRLGGSLEFSIFEASERVGGWIQSHCFGDYFFDSAPRSFRTSDAKEALELIDELNLTSDLLQANPEANHRFIYYRGTLHPLPQTLLEFFKTPLFKGCFSAFFNDLIQARGIENDESVYSFFSRRLSKTFADRLIDPLVKGIYAGDAKALSMSACFPSIWEMEKTDRSLLKAFFKTGFKREKTDALFTLTNGFETLIKKLAERLSKNIYLSTAVEEIDFERGSPHLTIKGERRSFDYVVSTLSGHHLVRILRGHQELKKILNSLSYASVGIVHLGYSQKVMDLKGFGYLVPSQEKEKIMGVIFDSALFPEQNLKKDQTRLTVMLGGILQKELVELSEKERIALAKESVEKHLKIKESPSFAFSSVAKNGIPQYPVGFKNQLETFFKKGEKHPRLLLLGTSFHGVSVNQLIAQAKKVATTLELS